MHATTPVTGPADRPAAARDRWAIADSVPVIELVLVTGLVLRLLLAFVVFPQSGSWSDISQLGDWSLVLADVGPVDFYSMAGAADPTPGTLVVLWVLGVSAKLVAIVTGGAAVEIIPVWIKLPAIVADVLVAWVFYRAIRRWYGPPTGEAWGVLVAAAYLFVPVTWYDSALWGQVDAFGVLLAGLTLIWLVDRRAEAAAAAATAAALVEPRLAFLLPVVAVVLVRRHLHLPRPAPVSDDPAHAPDGDHPADRDGPDRLVTSALAAFGTLILVSQPFDLLTRAPADLAGIPFLGDLAGLAAVVMDAVGANAVVTADAFNPWALVGPTPLATTIGGDRSWTSDALELAGVPAATIGAALFLAVLVGVALLLWRRPHRDGILVAAVILATASFVLPTRMDERSLVAAVGLGVLLLPRSRGWWGWFGAASAVALVNLHALLTAPFRGAGTPELRGLPLGDLARHPWVVALAALVCIPVLLWPLRDGWRVWIAGPAPAGAAPLPTQSRATAPDPTPSTRVGPFRPPRPLFRGRIRPRDLLLATVIAAALCVVRLYGLERPLGWTPEEDLRAGTATGLLQDWRYGRPHAGEGWTQPPFARYLMAASIEAFGGHEVNATFSLGIPVRDAVVEPQGANGSDTAPSPGRLFAATDAGLLVRDLPGARRELTVELPGIAHLAYASDDRLLWAATDDGRILRMDVARLDAAAAPTDASLATEMAAVSPPIDGLWAMPGGGAAVSAGGTLTLVGPEGEIAGGTFPGLTDVDLVPGSDEARLALTLPDGIHLVSVPDLLPVAHVTLDRRPLRSAFVDGTGSRPQLRDPPSLGRLYVVTRGGLATVGGLDTDEPFVDRQVALPGPATDLRWNPSTDLVHVLGEQDGRPTIYVVEPHGTAVFADAELPATAVGWDLDVRQPSPGDDRQRAVVVAADGTVALVGLGGTAFATRLPGALLGGIAGALVWLLLVQLSWRRVAATIGLVMVATETLLLAQAHIATPDMAAIAFVLAAWTLLAWLLGGSDPRRHRWRRTAGLPVVGLLLGLAASSAWSGFFGLGGVLLFLAILAAWQRVRRDGRRPRDLVPLPIIAWGLVAIPVAAVVAYVLLYVPWAFLAGGEPQLFAGWPKGHTGELFMDMQSRLLAFHAGPGPTQPSASPWWSWPLLLKPIWAYLEGFGGLVGSIVLVGNPVVVWLSLPAVAWAAWRLVRHGLQPALLLLVVAFAAQWLPWAGVGRAAHLTDLGTAIPFGLALLALLLARAWAGLSPSDWRLLRALVVTVAFLPAVVWAAAAPLCSTLAADASGGACGPAWVAELPLIAAAGIAAFVVTVGAVAQRLLDRWQGADASDAEARQRIVMVGLAGTAIVLAVAFGIIVVGRTGLMETWVLTVRSPLAMAVLAAAIALPVAALAATARSPRRLVAGILLVAVTFAVLAYPLTVGIRVPLSIALLSQGLLPTADIGFVFGGAGSAGLAAGLLVIGLPLLLVGVGAWSVIRALDRRRLPG